MIKTLHASAIYGEACSQPHAIPASPGSQMMATMCTTPGGLHNRVIKDYAGSDSAPSILKGGGTCAHRVTTTISVKIKRALLMVLCAV